jgi:DNA-binding transcriptional LysR family regulator
MFDWSDLRYFLAVARHRSTAAAGRALKVDQSTVQRRLAELERRIGAPLVKRQQSGCCLTAYGERLLPLAEQVEQSVLALERHVADARREVSGVVRVTCPEPLMYRINASNLFERLSLRHPALKVEFVMCDRYLDLSRGEADVALRAGDTEGNLVGRKIADSAWAIYGSRKYVDRHGQPDRVEDLAQHALVGFDGSMSDHGTAQWLRQVAPNGNIVASNNSMLGMVYSAKAGLGLAALPTVLGDAEPDLVRVLGPIPELARIWRILTTPELRHTPRVAALFDFMVDEVATLRAILSG